MMSFKRPRIFRPLVGFFPDLEQFLLVQEWALGFELVWCEDEVANFAGDHGLGAGYEAFQVVEVGVLSHDDEVELVGVEAAGEVADEVDFVGLAEVVDHAFDDVIDAGILAHEAVDVGEEGVLFVGLEDFAVLLGVCFEQAGFFKAVELQAYGIGAVAKLSFEATQIARAGSVQEELQHEFDAGFRSN